MSELGRICSITRNKRDLYLSLGAQMYWIVIKFLIGKG